MLNPRETPPDPYQAYSAAHLAGEPAGRRRPTATLEI